MYLLFFFYLYRISLTFACKVSVGMAASNTLRATVSVWNTPFLIAVLAEGLELNV
jgi:hypothetical protein